MLEAWAHVFRETMRGLHPPKFDYEFVENSWHHQYAPETDFSIWRCRLCNGEVVHHYLALHAARRHGFSTPGNIRITDHA